MAWMVSGFLYLVSIPATLDHQAITQWYIGTLIGLNVGLVLGIAAGLTIALLVIREASRWAGSGLLLGSGVACLWLAHLNRDGPGMVCTHAIRSRMACAPESDWRIWLLLGLASLALGLVLGLVALARARSGRSESTS